MAKRYGFGKKDKLKSRKQIETLFATGKSFTVPPLRVTYKFFPVVNDVHLQAGVTASKKYYKKAVDRNRIKRLIREAYRLQKADLATHLAQSKLTGHVFFIYTAREILSFTEINRAMEQCLKRLEQKATHTHENPA
jgi:ribonuclease P protein component